MAMRLAARVNSIGPRSDKLAVAGWIGGAFGVDHKDRRSIVELETIATLDVSG
jgi:hypothetical protein